MSPTGAAALHFGRSGLDMSAKGALTRAEVMIWLESSCAAQGIPLLIVDRATLRQVGILLGMGTEGLDGGHIFGASRTFTPPRPSSTRCSCLLEPPDDFNAIKIEIASASLRWSVNANVIDECFHDCHLSSQIEVLPLFRQDLPLSH